MDKYQYQGSTHYFQKVPQKNGIPWWVWVIAALMVIGWANGGKSQTRTVPASYNVDR